MEFFVVENTRGDWEGIPPRLAGHALRYRGCVGTITRPGRWRPEVLDILRVAHAVSECPACQRGHKEEE
jgi:hypothetical protein